MPTAVIFDVDGVLVDSYHAHLESWLETTREHDIPFSEADFALTFGRTSREIVQLYWPDGPALGDDVIRAIDDRKEALYRELVASSFPAMDGATELIDAVHEAGIQIAAGSSGPPENVELCLERLGRRARFGAVVTGLDVDRGKPDPQVFQIAAARLGVDPGCCIVIEDAPAGIDAAHRAGMKCVGLVSTGRTHRELDAADSIIESLRDLSPAAIASLLESCPT